MMGEEGRKLILLVDDEPSLSEALAFTLEARGFQCTTARDMTEGLDTLSKKDVSVVVTDIMMPAGDRFAQIDASEAGFQLINRIRQSWPRVPIVCLSVIGDQEKIEALTARGIRYLRKGETPLATAVEVITALASGRRIRL